MPLTRCTEGGKSGWRWGSKGKCYPGNSGKKQAIKQGYAEDPKHFSEEMNSSAELRNDIAAEFNLVERLFLASDAKKE